MRKVLISVWATVFWLMASPAFGAGIFDLSMGTTDTVSGTTPLIINGVSGLTYFDKAHIKAGAATFQLRNLEVIPHGQGGNDELAYFQIKQWNSNYLDADSVAGAKRTFIYGGDLTGSTRFAYEVDLASPVQYFGFEIKSGSGNTGFSGVTSRVVFTDVTSNVPIDLALEYVAQDVGLSDVALKFGRTTNADSGVTNDVWDRSNATDDQAIWIPPTAARRHSINSTDANDTSGGTGARTVKIFGLDTNWDRRIETVTMNGITGVSTQYLYTRINRMKVVTAGTAGWNAGDISAEAETDGTITAQITTAMGQTQMAIFSVPSNHVAYMTLYYASINSSGGGAATPKRANISLFVTEGADQATAARTLAHTQAVIESAGPFSQPFFPYFKIPEKTDIVVNVNTNFANGDISAGFDLILQDK